MLTWVEQASVMIAAAFTGPFSIKTDRVREPSPSDSRTTAPRTPLASALNISLRRPRLHPPSPQAPSDHLCIPGSTFHRKRHILALQPIRSLITSPKFPRRLRPPHHHPPPVMLSLRLLPRLLTRPTIARPVRAALPTLPRYFSATPTTFHGHVHKPNPGEESASPAPPRA